MVRRKLDSISNIKIADVFRVFVGLLFRESRYWGMVIMDWKLFPVLTSWNPKDTIEEQINSLESVQHILYRLIDKNYLEWYSLIEFNGRTAKAAIPCLAGKCLKKRCAFNHTISKMFWIVSNNWLRHAMRSLELRPPEFTMEDPRFLFSNVSLKFEEKNFYRTWYEAKDRDHCTGYSRAMDSKALIKYTAKYKSLSPEVQGFLDNHPNQGILFPGIDLTKIVKREDMGAMQYVFALSGNLPKISWFLTNYFGSRAALPSDLLSIVLGYTLNDLKCIMECFLICEETMCMNAKCLKSHSNEYQRARRIKRAA